MKIKKIIMIVVGLLTVSMCGCSAAEPEYFDSITKTVENNWTNDALKWWPMNALIKEQSDTLALDGGGHEEQGIFVYYVREDDTYYEFDLSDQQTARGQQDWQHAGAFRRQTDDTTFLCWHNFDIENSTTPDLAIVEFPAKHPENYTAQFYTLGTEDSFSICVNDCYILGDSIYVMWRDNQGQDRLCAIQQDEGQIQDLGKETALLKQYAVEKSSASFVGQYCVLSENDGVTIYGADIREADDMPPISLVFMAVKDGKTIAGLYYDLTLDEAPEIALEQF